jgi:hypothetical protein
LVTGLTISDDDLIDYTPHLMSHSIQRGGALRFIIWMRDNQQHF